MFFNYVTYVPIVVIRYLTKKKSRQMAGQNLK